MAVWITWPNLLGEESATSGALSAKLERNTEDNPRRVGARRSAAVEREQYSGQSQRGPLKGTPKPDPGARG